MSSNSLCANTLQRILIKNKSNIYILTYFYFQNQNREKPKINWAAPLKLRGPTVLKWAAPLMIKGAGHLTNSIRFSSLFYLPNTPFFFPYSSLAAAVRTKNPKPLKIHPQILISRSINKGQILITRLATSFVSFS